MSLVFGAICPHPPILIPTIGKENLSKLKNTKRAMEQLAEDLYFKNAETIIIISPHGQLMPDNFIINHSPVLKGNFKDFGDLETNLEFNNDLGLGFQIRESIETKIPAILANFDELDHGCLVPLYYLSQKKKNYSIIPIVYSLLDWETHYNFGLAIKNIINQTNKRIAVIASGDLSHRLTKDAPAGYSPIGKEFDKKLIQLLKEKKIKEIFNLDPKFVDQAGECGFRSILILLGIFSDLNYQFEALSYQSPFGIGYLVANFKLI